MSESLFSPQPIRRVSSQPARRGARFVATAAAASGLLASAALSVLASAGSSLAAAAPWLLASSAASLLATASAQETSAPAPQEAASAADATPRLADGTPNLGPLEDGMGFWDRGSGPMVGGADYPPPAEIPFKPWARALFDYRQSTLAKDDPHVRCAPPGGPRQFAVPFGLQIIQVPSIKRIFILSGGSTRPWRVIYMDGRQHPPPELLNPTYFGHSIGHWEGDTLVVDTIGFNERFWLHREGYPHTEALHLIERISRPNVDTLRYEVTIDDPRTYTAPWTASWNKEWTPDEDIIEYFCHDNNRDQFRMVGAE